MSRYSGRCVAEFPLSPQQEFLWEGIWFRSLGREIMSRNNPFIAIELGGDLDVAQLRHALTLMVRRHESLRTMLTNLGPEPYQRVMDFLDPLFSFIDLTERVPQDHRMIIANNLVAGERASEFDLAGGPLWRCMLIRVSPDVRILTLSISHLFVDALSLVSFVRELMRHYTGEQVPDLTHQYRDVAERYRGPISGIEEKLDYWRRQLLPLRGALPFPTDYPASPPSMVSWATENFRNAPDVLAFRSARAARSATSFVLNAAAYAATLGCTGGVQRVIIGSSVARLDLKPSADMLGYFQDPIFLAVRVRPCDTLESLITQVRETFAAARDNVVPYFQLASAVNSDFARQRPWPGIYLYDTWVRGRVVEVSRTETFTVPDGVTARLFPAPNRYVAWDLTDLRHEEAYSRCYLPSLYVNDVDGSGGYLRYNRALFRSETISRIAGRHRAMIECMMTSPDMRVGEAWIAIKKHEKIGRC